MTNHPTPEEWMTYLYEKVDADVRSALAAHLRGCETCRAQVATWRDAMRELDRWRVSDKRAQAPWLPRAVRWAVAAMLLLALGYSAAWLSRPAAPDVKRLRREIELSLKSSLENSIRDDLREELRKDFKVDAATTQAQLRNELANLAEYTVRASKATAEGILTEFVQSSEARRNQEQEAILTLLRQIEARRRQDFQSVQGDLVTLAFLTDDELLRTQGDIARMVALSGTVRHFPDGSGQPDPFREGRSR